MKNELLCHIKPSEFTFCSRCGIIARYGKKEFMCLGCRSDLFPKGQVSKLEFEEIHLAQEYEKLISGFVIQHREKLAVLRNDIGGTK